jgi:hypothetical protein
MRNDDGRSTDPKERSPSERGAKRGWRRQVPILVFLVFFPITLVLAANGGMSILVGGWSVYLGWVTILQSGDMNGLREMFPRLGQASDAAWQQGFTILGFVSIVAGVVVLITGRGR